MTLSSQHTRLSLPKPTSLSLEAKTKKIRILSTELCDHFCTKSRNKRTQSIRQSSGKYAELWSTVANVCCTIFWHGRMRNHSCPCLSFRRRICLHCALPDGSQWLIPPSVYAAHAKECRGPCPLNLSKLTPQADASVTDASAGAQKQSRNETVFPLNLALSSFLCLASQLHAPN